MSEPTEDPVSETEAPAAEEPLAGDDALERLADKQEETDLPATPGA